MKAVVEAFNTADYGDSPQFLELEVTEDLLATLEALQALCVNGIISVNATISGEWVWESEAVERDLRLYGDDVVVNKHGVWFQTFVKHQERGHVECKELSLIELRNDFNGGKDVVFYGDDPDSIESCYEDAKAGATEE